MSVLVVGDRAALSLAGHPSADGAPALVVALDDAAVPAGVDVPVLRWPRSGAHAPWPAADALFELPAPSAPGRVLVVGEAGEEGVAELARRGIEGRASARLDADLIAEADAVIHQVGPPVPLPGDAVAVLAAGRLLVTNADPAFGFLAGIDHLAAPGLLPACDLIEAALAAPHAYAAVRRHARLAAERHRASRVYPRLAASRWMI